MKFSSKRPNMKVKTRPGTGPKMVSVYDGSCLGCKKRRAKRGLYCADCATRARVLMDSRAKRDLVEFLVSNGVDPRTYCDNLMMEFSRRVSSVG